MLPIKDVIATKVSDERIIQTVARDVPSRVPDDSCDAVIRAPVTLSAAFVHVKI